MPKIKNKMYLLYPLMNVFTQCLSSGLLRYCMKVFIWPNDNRTTSDHKNTGFRFHLRVKPRKCCWNCFAHELSWKKRTHFTQCSIIHANPIHGFLFFPPPLTKRLERHNRSFTELSLLITTATIQCSECSKIHEWIIFHFFLINLILLV